MKNIVTIYYASDFDRKSSHALLARASENWCSKNGYADANRHIIRPKRGKPHFEFIPDVSFSVTHSGSFWLCAFSEAEVGIDLQECRAADTVRIAKRFFHPEEAAAVEAEPDLFFRIWAAKESYVKYTGVGIGSSFSSFSAIINGSFAESINGVRLSFYPFRSGYEFCICSELPSELFFTEL